MSADSTNLASEFYVLSMLHRLGLNAALTLGNKKSVDIIVTGEGREAVNVDVKGAAGKAFFVDNQINIQRANHFVIFVSYLNKIHDPDVTPEVHIVPSTELAKVCNQPSPSGKHIVHLSALRRHSPPCKNDWNAIINFLQTHTGP